jgi:LuxR family maltose regulon positive regulatory protein
MAEGDVAGARMVLPEQTAGPAPLLAVARSRLDMIEGRPTEAIECAARALLESGLAPRERLELSLVQAAAALGLGQRRQAEVFAGYACAAFGECRSIGALLSVEDSVRRDLLRMAPWPLDEIEAERLGGGRSLYRSAQATVRLSRGEQTALLSFEATGSRKETARQLYRSLNTVKTQLNSAYRKLGTSSLQDALARARALGLLPESQG